MENHGVRLDFEISPNLLPLARDLQVIDYGPDVQPGPSHQHGPARPNGKFVQGFTGCLLEHGNREVLGGIYEVEKVCRNLRPFGRARRCRADVHAPVDGHGVHGDQFGTRPTAGQFQRQGRFARGRGPHHDEVPIGLHRSGRGHGDPSTMAGGRCHFDEVAA